MTSPNDSGSEGLIRIESSDVGRRTIANSELLDARRTIAYAAGINEENQAYFDDTRPGGLTVHPGIAFALQWNSYRRLGAQIGSPTPTVGVHTETDLRIHRPFEGGMEITSQGRLIALRQTKSGVIIVDRFRMTDGRGELIAELDMSVLVFDAVLNEDDEPVIDRGVVIGRHPVSTA